MIYHLFNNIANRYPANVRWVTEQWNPAVQSRYQKLLFILAKKFDGKIEGVNLPETAIDINQKQVDIGHLHFSLIMMNSKYFEKIM